MIDLTAALVQLGWDERRTAELSELGHDLSAAARVVRVDRGHATLRAAAGDVRVATERLDAALAVGDWVAVGGEGEIAAVLERRSLLERRMPDDSSSSPVVAANVDIVVVANALDHSFSARRLERFLLVSWESGATPIVALTKADAAPDLAAAVAEAEAAALGAPVLALSVPTGQGIDELRMHLAGSTAVLMGRSGAGKSTLVNALLGEDVAATAEVRRDGKGRHTTTHRELHVLAGGGVLIDTPGLRRSSRTTPVRPWRARSAISRSWPRAAASPTAATPANPAARSRRRSPMASCRASASRPGSGPSTTASSSSAARTRPRRAPSPAPPRDEPLAAGCAQARLGVNAALSRLTGPFGRH